MRAPTLAAAALGLALVGLAGCSGTSSDAPSDASSSASGSSGSSTSDDGSDSTDAAESDEGSTTPTPAATPIAEPPVPARSGCYRLTYNQAVSPTSRTKPSRCDRGYTARTYRVGTLDNVVDGHLLAVDSGRVQRQLADTCPQDLGGFLGGDAEDLRLSMFRPIWFSPTIEASDKGQRWYRCDVIAISAPERLAGIEGDLEGVFDTDDWADTYGMCGTANPTDDGFQRVWCAADHSWRAISTVDADADPDARYPGAGALSDAGKDACEDPARTVADDPLDVTWTYEPPTADQWDAGQRYGICWVPV